MVDFRGMAREQLRLANDLLATGNDDDLDCAALKLRKAMEALTYERAKAYEDDLGPDTMRTWQPRKLMDRMLEIDPFADQTAIIRMGEEPALGERPKVMRTLGTDFVLSMSDLKKHYDAIGAYLHTPTLDQLAKGKGHNLIRLRERCDEIAVAVERVLSSRIWNSSFASRGVLECMECGKEIRRRLQRNEGSRTVQCWHCSASYLMTDLGEGKVRFEPEYVPAHCPVDGCDGEVTLWKNEVEAGGRFKCPECQTIARLTLGITVDESIPSEEG